MPGLAVDQQTIDYLADHLTVRYDVITNFRENADGLPRTDIKITLGNGGDADITETG